MTACCMQAPSVAPPMSSPPRVRWRWEAAETASRAAVTATLLQVVTRSRLGVHDGRPQQMSRRAPPGGGTAVGADRRGREDDRQAADRAGGDGEVIAAQIAVAGRQFASLKARSRSSGAQQTLFKLALAQTVPTLCCACARTTSCMPPALSPWSDKRTCLRKVKVHLRHWHRHDAEITAARACRSSRAVQHRARASVISIQAPQRAAAVACHSLLQEQQEKAAPAIPPPPLRLPGPRPAHTLATPPRDTLDEGASAERCVQ